MTMDFEKDLVQCLAILKDGGTILYPTDTIWGLGCDATNAAAVDKLFRIKNRPDEKAMIVLVADEKDILRYVAGADLGVFDYLEKETRPVTVIYDGAIGLADNLVGKDGSVAIRICRDEFCRHLIKRFRRPLVSTSANISGEPSPKNFNSISPAIVNAVDYVVHHRRDDRAETMPSKIIRWNKDGTVTVLRP